MTVPVPGPVWVVGGGTAGCTVLERLSAATTAPLVLAEPGPGSDHDDEPGFCEAAADGRLVRSRTVTVCDGGDPFDLVEARALGGGSAVNGMLLTGAVPPGLEGLTRRASIDDAGPVGRLLLGRGGHPVRLWWNNGRWNPGRAAHHLVDEGRVERVTAEVESLVVEGGRLRAVRVGGRERPASAVVMCAGAVGTPVILLGSGLGAIAPDIGVGLQNHPEVTADFTVTESFLGGHDACVVHSADTVHGRRLLTMAYERIPGEPAGRGRLATLLLDPESRGRVRLEAGGPQVSFGSLSDAGDRRAMIEAVKRLAGWCSDMESSGAIVDARIGGRSAGEWAASSQEAIEAALASLVGVVSHPASSCAGVIDGDGRMTGVEGIWIADASALPRVPPCTPAAEVVMLARRVADAAGEVIG